MPTMYLPPNPVAPPCETRYSTSGNGIVIILVETRLALAPSAKTSCLRAGRSHLVKRTQHLTDHTLTEVGRAKTLTTVCLGVNLLKTLRLMETLKGWTGTINYEFDATMMM